MLASAHGVSPYMSGTTTMLRVAREATDGIQIAKQILGSAAHIAELAERIQQKREAMEQLVEQASLYARMVDIAVAGRVLDAALQLRLGRLHRVFKKIEALVDADVRPKSSVKRALQNIFIQPDRAATLSRELEREIQLFQVFNMASPSTMLHTQLGETSDTTVRTLSASHRNVVQLYGRQAAPESMFSAFRSAIGSKAKLRRERLG
ncbi:hypothetical protein EXIGLDRAFT_708814 [Exidia glandulosa HHB12029]|uniref:Uncharacterized protein n=1 Tax=Exidia glandulosa HHB12029 TaxID=1314781 RepID=A0A165J696_EXIGL|nr:hypothetical protein EXIGLDRAFT_708814 [Exidia glandulosa HHB12029]